MSAAGLLLAAAPTFPLLLGASALWRGARAHLLRVLPVAPLPALAAALLAPGGSLVLAPDPLRLTLALDLPGALLLGGAGMLWSLAGLYAARYMAGARHRTSFTLWWLFTMAGTLGLFVVADLASFYLAFSLASLAAYGLVAQERNPEAERAARVYMVLALLGEAFLLMGFVLMAVGVADGNPMIAQALERLPASPWREAILALLILGFGLKMGLVPLHVWMPLAHPVAPMPASAVLSGIIVKAGIIGLIRFLPFEAGAEGWGTALVVLGLFTAYYAVAVGLAQRHPKVVLAYSTVSQMGVIAAVLGAGLAAGDPRTRTLAAYYALHHMLVKGALFLGTGLSAGQRNGWKRVVMAVLAFALAGLPLTSGMLAKYVVKDVFAPGPALWLVTLSAAGSAALMLHFLHRLAHAAEAKRAGPVLLASWLGVGAASLVAAWALFPVVTNTSAATLFSPATVWKASWPILIGVLLVLPPLRLADRVPHIPPGDVIVWAERLLPRLRRLAEDVERLDAFLRRWPVAALLLVLLMLLLGAALQLSA
ncbi:complex I subunit 5 family protein [Ancylobacter sp. 6x-1]|uniref:Complex I subunit 5 family protein n=1 Tax=Ancylobacter crimeensis TaxID=2579147 RepID=A0ABT0D747_9HYPH|nr:complex I subunit 5 family protein [Ancylobacter crimeensis]MCK0195757.1 complex I subunit 5 family protein [Ancylobacter crimeensis]